MNQSKITTLLWTLGVMVEIITTWLLLGDVCSHGYKKPMLNFNEKWEIRSVSKSDIWLNPILRSRTYFHSAVPGLENGLVKPISTLL